MYSIDFYNYNYTTEKDRIPETIKKYESLKLKENVRKINIYFPSFSYLIWIYYK